MGNHSSTSFDWRQNYGVSKVKNQGSCGSCWAFSATGAIESRLFIQYGPGPRGDRTERTPRLLSEQQLIDCSQGKYGNHGCNGGWPSWAIDYVTDTGGIACEKCYPYTACTGTKCKY